MAALRIFARSAIPAIRAPLLTGDSWKNTFLLGTQKKWGSVKVGIGDNSKTINVTDFDVSTDPNEWSYVEWTLPQKIIPSPPSAMKDYPSGWIPQSSEALKLPYFIERTKNHMIPVYLRLVQRRGLQKVTYVRRIQGDVMLLEKELREYLEKKTGKKIASKINEPAGLIKYRGDFVSLSVNYLLGKGF